MDITQQGLIALMKSALTGKSQPLPEAFSLTELHPLISSHHINAQIYQGAVLCGISRSEPVMQQLFRDYCKALLRSEGQVEAFTTISRAFEENGIDYLPLKGCKLKALYPKPELRTMSDADILIRLEQRPQIQQIMEELGFQEKKETDHEWVWTNRQLFVELHKHLIPSYNEDFYAYFGKGWQLAVNRDGHCYSMRVEDEMLFLFTHFTKHYRDGGIGCRYVADLWMYLQAHPELDMDYLEVELRKMRLWEFFCNIRQLINVWFEDGQSDEKIDFITDVIFASGSWGKIEDRTISVGVREKGKTGAIRSKMVYLRKIAFPNTNMLKSKYTVLQKAPWLLPAVWLYRPFYKVAKERKSLMRHQDMLQKLTPENLQTRQDALNYVGLDYHL